MEQLSQWPLLQLLPLCWAVGRLLLALLPAGEPGGGRIGETWLVQATSFGLGWLALESGRTLPQLDWCGTVTMGAMGSLGIVAVALVGFSAGQG